MDCNFTTIKTCELKDSTFRSRILDFGDFDISDYTFSVVYRAGFDQIISEQELTAIGNILTVPLEAIEGVSSRAKAEVWMFRDGGFKDKVIVFDVVISATGCPSDASITEGVSVTFGGLKVPVEVNQGIVNISREVAFSTLSPDEKLELKGEKGDQGEIGDVGPQGPQGDPLTFSDLTTQQVNELKQPALDAAVIATTAAQNADTAAGLATDATVEAVNATGQAIAATAQAENAAENADEAAVEALAAKDAANAAAANTAMRYNDTADTLAPDVIRRVDKVTKIEQEYKETTKNIDGINMTDAMVDGFMYIKRGNKYYINSDFAVNRTVYVESYGLPGDNQFRTIASHFPNVTLAEVQSLDPTATLSNSADWYMLMWLNRHLPVNSTLILTGKYVIDKKISWRRSSITWKGEIFKWAGRMPADKAPQIRQIGAGEDCIAFLEGDGITNHYTTQILNVRFKDFNIVGTLHVNPELMSGDGISINIANGDMVYCYFDNIRLSNHGGYGLKHYAGHVNEVYFTELNAYSNYDCGMWWNGTPQSQTNLLYFNKCSFGANGLVHRNGALVMYDYLIDGFGENNILRNTKGAASFGNTTGVQFLATAMQQNGGFGLMIRDGSPTRGMEITGYSELNPLGGYVILADLNSSTIKMNTNSQYATTIYPEIGTTPHYSTFKSLAHLRKFLPEQGIENNLKLLKRPWSENVITDAKNRKPGAITGSTHTVTYSVDSLGSTVTTVAKQPDGLNTVEWLTYEEWNKIPYDLEVGDMISMSFDIKFNSIHADDVSSFAFAEFGVRGYFWVNLKGADSTFTADGQWKRVHFTYEFNGTRIHTDFARPVFRLTGYQPLTYSVRNPEVRVKSRKSVFGEPAPNATTVYKGVVNQAAAVANVATADATDLATALTLVNELKAKLNAKLASDRTAGQQAT